MATWPVQELSQHTAEILDEADVHGPQIISAGGRERSVVLSLRHYHELLEQQNSSPASSASLTALPPPYRDFKDWLLNGPTVDEEQFFTDLQEGRKDLGRTFEFEDDAH